MPGLIRYTLALTAGLFLVAEAAASQDAVADYLKEGTSLKEGKSLLGGFTAPLSQLGEEQCLEFLKHSFSEDEVVIGRVRQNDLADWLLQQPQHTESSTKVILEIVADESADLLWREFCVQKLALALEQSVLTPETAARCLDSLIEKAGDTRISFSGSALLGLYRLSKKDPSLIDPQQVATLAEHVLDASNYANANKVTALQVAGLSGSERAVRIARAYIGDPTIGMQLRVSAVALIGRAGNDDDLTELRRLARSLDFRLRKAAASAILNLTKT